MAGTSGKEYWLYKEIEEEFRHSVNPWEMFNDHIRGCLTERDVKRYYEFLMKVGINNFRRIYVLKITVVCYCYARPVIEYNV